MRRFSMLVLVQLAAAAPLAAQFEGTVSMRVSGGATQSVGGDISMKMMVKGDQQATILTLPNNGGPMAGAEMRMVYDPKTMTATSLMPIPAQLAQVPMFANAKGIKMVADLSKAQANPNTSTDVTVDVKKLGTSEKIAGFDCDDYEIKASNGDPMRACITPNLGHFLFPSMGGPMGRGASSSPAWTKAFGTKPGFPLKVWSPAGGGVAMEVTSVEKGSVPASMFEIPDGYVDMASLMGGRRGGGL
jgi:hypothetical protein